jgi:two-component response regulator (ARR-B family)
VTLIGNSTLASSSSTRPDLQIDNSVMVSQVLNGGGASDNLLVGSTVNLQAVSDQVNNINDFLMGTSEAWNVESDDVDDFLAYFNQVRSFLHLFMHKICLCPDFH